MILTKKIVIFSLLACLFMLPAFSVAQDEDLYPGGTYNKAIPTPLDIIGHRFGALHTFHWEMEDFIQAVEKASGRVKVVSYGETYQGRKLYTVFISAPENMEKLEEIRTDNLKLTDPRTLSQPELDRIASSMPAIVWLGYNIHGNEVTGMESAIRTIYQLAAGTDEKTLTILKNVVSIIDPVQNPDGHERYTHYQRSVVTVKSHPQGSDVEHSNPWPGGRTNHYLFDLNRDFFLKTQIESLQKAKHYHDWMPHVFPDLHEMGTNSTYFFAPPMPPYNEFVIPELMKWWNIIADANARAFDHFGWGYYTKESFDSFYPGYGTSYPSINGAIGMTYEQASTRGVSSYRDDGSLLTLREGSWHHFTTSMATLQVVSERREERIRDFHNFFVTGLKDADTDPMKEIILVPDNDPQITEKLVANMLIEKVEIKRAAKPFTNRRATSYITKKTASKTFPKGSYIITLKQPQKILIKALLAPDSPLKKEFIEEEKKRQERGERGNFYDVTAWSMPLTYGINAYWTGENSNVEAEPVTEAQKFTGEVIGGKSGQVYLIPFNSLAASKILNSLLSEDYRVRIARKSFTIDGVEWPAGTLVVRVNRNPESIHNRIKELAQTHGVNVTAVSHLLAEAGIDLGSNNINTLNKPEIALMTESPVSSGSYGVIHYLFEREFGLPFTRLNARNLSNLRDYNVVVLPSGSYSSALNESQLNSFKEWIRSGGTVVAVSGATSWLRQAGISQAKVSSDRPGRTPGAIVRVNLNPLSFLSYGVPDSVAMLVRSSSFYIPFEDESKNVGRFASFEDLKLSGFIWPKAEKILAEKGCLFMERFGRGKLILFTEDPNFRASYDGLNKLFLNAILLGPSLR